MSSLQPALSRSTFADSVKIEQQAAFEGFIRDARKTLEEQLRSGSIVGPMVIDRQIDNQLIGKPLEGHLFNMGRFTTKSRLWMIRQPEVATPDSFRVYWTLQENGRCTAEWTQPSPAPSAGEVFYLIEELFDFNEPFVKRLREQSSHLPTWPDSQLCDRLRSLTPAPNSHARERALNACLDRRIPLLLIKGPPGTGKTDLLAEAAGTLVQQGKSVLVLSTSHDAVDNALSKIRTRFEHDQIDYVVKHASKEPFFNDIGVITSKVARHPFQAKLPDDTLIYPQLIGFVLAAAIYKAPADQEAERIVCFDEAGQIPAFNAAALATLGNRLLFFGDEAQLPPITRGAHAPHTFGDRSSMDYLRAVIGSQWSIALDRTWRMNRDICGLIQRHFYPDVPTLQPEPSGNPDAHLIDPTGERMPSLCQQAIRSATPCLSLNTPEVQHTLAAVRRLLRCQVVLGSEAPRSLQPSDIAILTPYRNQANAIRNALRSHGIHNLQQVGTVDRMQGQDACVVIYSLCASNPNYIATQGEFLFSSNRWNVALSRAKAHALVIGDTQVHRSALPYTLAGINAQSTILSMLDDPAWRKE